MPFHALILWAVWAVPCALFVLLYLSLTRPVILPPPPPVEARAEPAVRVVQNTDGSVFIYADPSDNEVQCLGRVCIGNQFAACNEPHLRAVGVTHIVSAIGEPERRLDGIEYLVLALDDVPGQSITEACERAHEFITRSLASSDGRVLVHCAAGVSRSATLLVYHLMRARSLSYDDALAAVRAVRPVVLPNHGFERQLRAHDAETRTREL